MRQLHEQMYHQVEELKKQADKHEKVWQEKKEHEVTAWRERIHREQEHWQHQIQQNLETCHTQHQREMEDVLRHSYLPNCAKTTTGSPPSKWAGKWKSSADTLSRLHNRQSVVAGQKKSRDGLKQRKKSVRFQENASIHIIEEDELDLECDAPPSNEEQENKTEDRGGRGGEEEREEGEGGGDKEENREGA